jgi:hypothetical protein
VDVGDIVYNPRHYLDPQTGESKGKYFLVLAFTRADDAIVRLLTSRQHGRPEDPRCFHGDPYPSFFLGVLGDRLPHKSWLDLRNHPNLESGVLRQRLKSGAIEIAMKLALPLLMQAMECAAAAPDTTREQEQCIRDALSRLRRPPRKTDRPNATDR